MERFDGTAVSLRIVITLASTNHVTVSIFVPFLSTNQVEPTITFAIELAAAFIQDIVDVNGCRSSGCHFSTEITIHFLVLGIAVSPATGTGTKHVHQVTGRLAGLCGSSFYGSFGSNQIKFGELGDVIRTGTSRIGLSCSGAVVCTIRAEFPKTGIYIATYRNNTDGNVTYCNLSGSGCFILNNTLLKELGVEVKGYADLLQPELKGKIAMGDPTASSSAFAELTNMLLDMGEGDTPADRYMSDAAWDYIAKFIDNIDGIVLSSSSQVYKNVIAGEYAVGVSYEDPVVQAIIDNKDNPDADLSLVYPEEGAVWLPAGVAIVKNAPNMDNAKLFVDYVLSEEAQTALSKTTIRGTMTSIAQDCPEMKPFEEINVVYEDQAAVAELQTEMLEKWTNLLTK